MCTLCPGQLATNLDGSFATLVDHHRDLVYGVARRVTGNDAEAEDAAQEAFLRAYRALQRYEPARTRDLRLRGWLARITLNVARNRVRDRGPAEATLEAAPEPVTARASGPEAVSEQRESARMWARLLDGLPARYGTAVGLRHVDGLSYAELAEALGRPVGTVRSDVHRGVKLLRAAYEAEVRR